MALAGAANAADLQSRAPPIYLPPPPVFTWTGFYAGLNAGYTFGGSNSVDVETMSGVATSEHEKPTSATPPSPSNLAPPIPGEPLPKRWAAVI
jgi:opacity protein-like surface antigen